MSFARRWNAWRRSSRKHSEDGSALRKEALVEDLGLVDELRLELYRATGEIHAAVPDGKDIGAAAGAGFTDGSHNSELARASGVPGSPSRRGTRP